MTVRHLKLISILSTLFWAALLLHVYQSFIQPLPDDDRARQFAERYRITSSIQVIVIVIAGVTFSLLVWLRRAAWAAIALTCLAVFVLWKWYLAGLPGLFRSPLGDGTLERATSIWWRLHESLLVLHIAKVTLLMLSAVIWPFVYARLAKGDFRPTDDNART